MFEGYSNDEIHEMVAIARGPEAAHIVEARESRRRWDEHFMHMAQVVSYKSKDESRRVGCVIVGQANNILSTGYNGLPRGCNDDIPTRQDRPEKYYWFEHAERNALYNSARHGVTLEGSTAYCTWITCADCARGLIQSGITRIVLPTFTESHLKDSKWIESWSRSRVMLKEAGIKYDYI